jgi:hypothetical protein
MFRAARGALKPVAVWCRPARPSAGFREAVRVRRRAARVYVAFGSQAEGPSGVGFFRGPLPPRSFLLCAMLIQQPPRVNSGGVKFQGSRGLSRGVRRGPGRVPRQRPCMRKPLKSLTFFEFWTPFLSSGPGIFLASGVFYGPRFFLTYVKFFSAARLGQGPLTPPCPFRTPSGPPPRREGPGPDRGGPWAFGAGGLPARPFPGQSPVRPPGGTGPARFALRGAICRVRPLAASPRELPVRMRPASRDVAAKAIRGGLQGTGRGKRKFRRSSG